MPNLICYQILMSRTNFYHLENACNQETNKHLHFCILPPMLIQALTSLVETQLTILSTATVCKNTVLQLASNFRLFAFYSVSHE